MSRGTHPIARGAGRRTPTSAGLSKIAKEILALATFAAGRLVASTEISFVLRDTCGTLGGHALRA
jgi:hypothetical protein